MTKYSEEKFHSTCLSMNETKNQVKPEDGSQQATNPYIYPPSPQTPTSTPATTQTTCNQQTLSLPSLPPTHAHTIPRYTTKQQTSHMHIHNVIIANTNLSVAVERQVEQLPYPWTAPRTCATRQARTKDDPLRVLWCATHLYTCLAQSP